MGCWCGFAPAPYIGTSSRQVLARSVLPESVFGFAFGDYPDLDLAIFTLARCYWPLSFSPRPRRVSSLLNLSRCASASSHHIPGNLAVVVIAGMRLVLILRRTPEPSLNPLWPCRSAVGARLLVQFNHNYWFFWFLTTERQK